jgi:CelD/BcsL family acetyltransferase involved in cellulose biosynthesis
LKIVQLDSFQQVQEFGLDWDSLLNMSKDNTVFLTLDWLETWWKHFGAERELLLLAVVENEQIIALAPLMVSEYKLFGVSMRAVEFVGSPSSDYHGFILSQQAKDTSECVRMILDDLKKRSWDCLELKNIPNSSDTAKELKERSRKSLKLKEKEMDICPYIPLPNTFDEYIGKLGTHFHKSLRRNMRRIENEYAIELQSFSQMNFQLEDGMKAFFKLHQQRCQSKGLVGKFADPVFSNFHIEVARRFHEKGWLFLKFLTLNSMPVATIYGFEYNGKFYDYLAGLNPEYLKYGVGNICHLLCLKDLIERGTTEYDMMRGNHTYKKSWVTIDRQNIELDAYRWKLVPKAYEWIVRGNIMPSVSSLLRQRALFNLRRK